MKKLWYDDGKEHVVVMGEANVGWRDATFDFLAHLPINERVIRSNGESDRAAMIASICIANFGAGLAAAGALYVAEGLGQTHGRAVAGLCERQQREEQELEARVPYSGDSPEWKTLEREYREQWDSLHEEAWIPGQGRPAPVVECVRCGSRHSSIFPWPATDSKQGSDCASFTYEDDDGEIYLSGGYGSSVADMLKFRVLDPTVPARLDPVCDGCVRRLEQAGSLELVGPTNIVLKNSEEVLAWFESIAKNERKDAQEKENAGS